MLEDQQQHRGHRTEAGEQDQRRAVDQRGDHQDGGERVDRDFHHLQVALDRPEVGVRALLVEAIGLLERAADGQGDGQHDEGAADVLHHGHRCLGQAGDQRHPAGEDQRRHYVGQAADDALLVADDVPAQRRGPEGAVQGARQQVLDDPVGQPGDAQQQGGAQRGEQVGPGLQPVEGERKFAGHERLLKAGQERPPWRSRIRASGAA
ncbi:hypothetical protein D3C78_1295110 [compost metagenome]